MFSLKTILPITTVKKDLMKLIKKAQSDGSSIIITKEGRAAGVLMSADEYEGLMETLDILSNQATVQNLNDAQECFDQGKTYTHKQVFEK
ncbi:MAG: type II toxin-antitoxin system Phd/YefM family antitoxin [bacterium]|nr:type II toxin-antitoxin system Phd/YefM family antitoxin [bacterium]MBU1918326.1 type II toxin-antitoxin system Phd/YefM family antitoxin [bacterium]